MFYMYRQNNSFGIFLVNDQVAHHVIVEARNAVEANIRAEEVGLYFFSPDDCPTCGDRWYEVVNDDDGSPVPSLYESPIEDFVDFAPASKDTYCYVYYQDKPKEIYLMKSGTSSFKKES